MYAPKQYRPEKRKPDAQFLALAELEPQHAKKTGGEQEQDKSSSKQEGKKQEANGNDLVEPSLRRVLALADAKPAAKEGGKQSSQPPQFKVKAGAPAQHKRAAAPVQRKAGAAAGVEAKGKNPQDKQLPEEVLDLMNKAFATDFSYVRIFANSAEAASLGALAFAQGTEIHFAPGQYNPDSPVGKQLIGHELTHVVQQSLGRVQANAEQDGMAINNDPALEEEADRLGNLAAQGQSTGLTAAAPPTPLVTIQHKKGDKEDKFKPKQKRGGAKQFVQTNTTGSGGPEGAHAAPATVTDLSNGFNPPKQIADFLNENAGKTFEINAKIGAMAKGKVKVKQKTAKAEGGAPADAEYKFESGQYLDYLENKEFFSAFKLKPVIALDLKDPKDIKGVLAFKIGATVAPDPKKFIEGINQSLDDMGLQGFERLQVPQYTNEVIGGQLHLEAPEIGTKIGGFLNATAKFGLMGNVIVFTAHADVDIKGMAQGALDIAKGEGGKYNGSAELGISIENVAGNIKVVYADGKITGRGEGSITSEKFKGSLTLIFDEKSVADAAVHEGMDVAVVEGSQEAAPESKGDGPRVVAGFGSVEVQVTPWLTATAMVGIDSEGHVTIKGKMEFPGEMELMEQKDKKTDIFNLEIKAGYGVPLVGQIFLFASLGMFVKAGFGPLVLHDIGMEGTYSTDPKVMNNFKITGALGISAYAQVGLSVKAGAGLTLLGHDVKAGIDLTASAGLKAYAEARPTFEYLEKAGPGGKVGEAHLKGHFEAAAQLFLELAGAFFVDLDSPWWSPVPDNHWEWPFGSMTLPIGDSMGVGADVDWLVGSPDAPELKFSPVEFDPDKFMSDMTKDPETVGQKGGKGGENKQDGSWVDGSGGSGDKTADPKLGPVKDGKKKEPKEDLTKLPDQEKYLRSLDEVGQLSKTAESKPFGKGALKKKLDSIKAKYALGSIAMVQPKDDSVKVHVHHKDKDNSANLIEIKLLSKAELDKQFAEAVADLELKLKTLGHKETGAITESAAKAAAKETDVHFEVIDGVSVKVDGDNVVITGDVGAEDRKMASRPLFKDLEGTEKPKEGEEVKAEDLTMPKTIEKAGTVEVKTILPAVEAEIEAAKTGALIFEEAVASPKEALKDLLDEFGQSRLDKARSVLKLPIIHESGIEKVSSLRALGAFVAKETGLSKVFLNKTGKGWSLSGQINPTVANLVSYAGAPAGLQPLITDVMNAQSLHKPNKDYFITLCNELAAKHGATVEFKDEFDKSTTPHTRITVVYFAKGTEKFDSQVIVDLSQKHTCASCGVNTPAITRPHNVVPGSYWTNAIKNQIGHFAPTISVNAKRVTDLEGIGSSTGQKNIGPASDDLQCTPCEILQADFSLIQRKNLSAANPPEFLGKQFQNSSNAEIQALTKSKVNEVIGKIRVQFATWKKTGVVKPGDDFYAFANNSAQTEAFLQKVEAEVLAAVQ